MVAMMDTLAIYADDKVFHSFRSTANQRLKKNGVEMSVRSQLIGHEREGTNEISYAWDLPVADMKDMIATYLIFPEIDFTPLKYPAGRFREFLPKEVQAAINRKRTKSPEEMDEKMKNHLEAKAAREARSAKKRGRPPKVTAPEA